MEKPTKQEQKEMKLPEGYDVINDYQNITEQAVVDNLFDYFGRVYYKDYGRNEDAPPRNHYVSKYDIKLFNFINKRVLLLFVIALIFIVLTIVGYIVYYFEAGSSFAYINNRIPTLDGVNGWGITTWKWVFYGTFTLISIFAFISLVLIGFLIYWVYIKCTEKSRINRKIKDWNTSFDLFRNNLSKNGIHNAIQAAVPNLVFDKFTPSYDRKTYNLHSRIYTFSDIPRDARKIAFKNLFSGFYKGCPFNVSYSSWEWFREAKLVNEEINDSTAIVNVKRSLRRFQDDICVLTLDTYAENKLNFVLNNPDGRNIRLQNKIFNNIFSLAVNNPKLAYTVFTPYVQHTLSRCKTWTDSCRAIRQVIKEGDKIYVVFDGKPDFFLLDRIVDTKLNYIFNSRNEYITIGSGYDQKQVEKIPKKVTVGSLDETATLMTEYILEELDVLFTALEMATCYPLDAALANKEKNKHTLYDVLEQKQNQYNDLKYKTIVDLNEKVANVSQAKIDLSEPFQPRFVGNKIDLPENSRSISDAIKQDPQA